MHLPTVDELFWRPGRHFFLIAGPCVLENKEVHAAISRELHRVTMELGVPVIFKASFDKANRTLGASPRGPGLRRGLKQLERVKMYSGLPVTTDVHHSSQVKEVAEVCDVLQVPAALCRQTDLLLDIGFTERLVTIKKGQATGIPEMEGAVRKVWAPKVEQDGVAIIERGSFFGYGDLVVDMRNIPRMQQACSVPVLFDVTHSIQTPATEGTCSGGRPEFIEPLALAAVAAGADGLFIETHPEPSKAPSDGASMLPLERLMPLMERVVAVREAIESGR